MIKILFSICLFVSLVDINRNDIIDTKWNPVDEDSTMYYFKYDNTFWKYKFTGEYLDSLELCKWEIVDDKINMGCFTDTSTISKSLQIIFCNDHKLILKDNYSNLLEFTKCNK